MIAMGAGEPGRAVRDVTAPDVNPDEGRRAATTFGPGRAVSRWLRSAAMTGVRRIVLPVLTLATVVLLAPGGLGDPEATVVTGGLSARAYRTVVAGVPGWLSGLGGYLTVAGLLVLAAALAWAGWRARTVAAAALAGAGTVLAYLVSEAAKLVVDEERPCRAFGELATWVRCPPPGDWSFPSNHATVAGALAAGVVLLAPRLAVVAVPAALVVAGMRVVTGVHYPHDVLAGLLLGAAVTVAVAGPPRGRARPRPPGSPRRALPGPR